MSDRYHEFQRTTLFAHLDGLRAISVIAVVWHHTAAPAMGHTLLLQQGYYGVHFFFAISGFLITTLLLREYRRNDRISYRKFLGRRSLRIFPLYYAVLGAYTLLTVATRRGTPEGEQFIDNLPAFASYTSNWFVDLDSGTGVTFYFAWSLATEEQFYLFWPPLLALLLSRFRGSLGAAIAVVAALVTVNQVAIHAIDGESLGLTIVRSLSLPMLLGVLFALLLDRERSFRMVDRVLGNVPVTLAAVAGLLALLTFGGRGWLIEISMVLIVVACCLPTRQPFTPVMRWKPIVRVGVVSYGIYLMHMLAANVVRPFVGYDYGALVFVGSAIVVYVAAELSFRFFESPLLRLKDRFFASPGKDHAASALARLSALTVPPPVEKWLRGLQRLERGGPTRPDDEPLADTSGPLPAPGAGSRPFSLTPPSLTPTTMMPVTVLADPDGVDVSR